MLHSTIRIMAPFLLAAIGGLFTELAGMLNIALEGLMLIGAFFSVIFAAATGSLFLGIALGIVASVLAAYIFGFISLHLRANIFITGLATNVFAEGLTMVLAFQIFGNKGVIRFANLPRLPVLSNPSLQRIPVLGDILVGHNILVYVSWLMVVLASIVIYKTAFGLRVRGTGSNPGAVEATGLSPRRYRMYAILISGFTCGLAGAILSLQLGAYVPGVTAGRGWIALVAIYLGNKTPLGILIACIVFGFAESLSNYAQGVIDVPADFILAFPYIITVVAMIAYSMIRHYRLRGSER
ncbi:MAG: ABC transporter permease [Candidatus Bipolaricaulota bacterium]|nr:MAG: ABC transporter permease [Candidatus Bipolaricaulota bacterium]